MKKLNGRLLFHGLNQGGTCSDVADNSSRATVSCCMLPLKKIQILYSNVNILLNTDTYECLTA